MSKAANRSWAFREVQQHQYHKTQPGRQTHDATPTAQTSNTSTIVGVVGKSFTTGTGAGTGCVASDEKRNRPGWGGEESVATLERAVASLWMCVNAFGFGAVHVFMLASAPLCILTAFVGQLLGCSSMVRAASGHGRPAACSHEEDAFFFCYGDQYECTASEHVFYFFNVVPAQLTAVGANFVSNGWQCATWTAITLITLQKPPKELMLRLFAPFMLFGLVQVMWGFTSPYAPDPPAPTWVVALCTLLWFGLFGYAYHRHEEPKDARLAVIAADPVDRACTAAMVRLRPAFSAAIERLEPAFTASMERLQLAAWAARLAALIDGLCGRPTPTPNPLPNGDASPSVMLKESDPVELEGSDESEGSDEDDSETPPSEDDEPVAPTPQAGTKGMV